MIELGDIVSFLFDPIALTGAVMLATTVTLWRVPSFRFVPAIATGWTLAFFALGSPAVANALIGWLEDRARVLASACAAPRDGALVIVLAGGVQAAPRPGEYEKLKEASLARLLPAARLVYGLQRSVLVVSGGQGTDVREADLMTGLARDMGIDSARIVADRESSSTATSAANIARLIGPSSASVPFLVTSANHMPRALATFHAAGLMVCAWPVDFREVHPPPSDWLIPRMTAFGKSTIALRELSSYFAYILLGRIDQ